MIEEHISAGQKAPETRVWDRAVPDAPLFPPDSVLRRLASESALMLGGGRALLLQLAHPLVAAGVAAHSGFQHDPLLRLERTMDLMLTLVLGDQQQARDMLRRYHAVHVPIHGVLGAEAGKYGSGTPYTAADPALRLWVLATLIDTTLLAYERFVAPLTPGERTRFYADSLVFARRMGLGAGVMPPTLDAFQEYMAGMLHGDTLVVNATARDLAHAVLHPHVGLVPRTGIRVTGFVAAGLLPPWMRRAYGLPWDARRQRALATLSWTMRTIHPVLPRAIRLMPQAGGSGLVDWAIHSGRPRPTDASSSFHSP
jgi:uncharacterized protein (DUF2236 family)